MANQSYNIKPKCNIHQRNDSANKYSEFDYASLIKNKGSKQNGGTIGKTMGTSPFRGETSMERRRSFTDGFNASSFTDKNRKRNSWNANMFKNIEHPSAFPSLLRSDVTIKNFESNTNDVRTNKTNLIRRSSMSALNGFRHTSNNANKMQSFGSNLYLRADSFGNLNLVHRDSIGSRNISGNVSTSNRKGSLTRDYVSAVATSTAPVKNNNNNNSKASILRRDSIDNIKDGRNYHSKDTLPRHVRILENDDKEKTSNGRRKSVNYSDSRRISVDSLDLRRSNLDLTDNMEHLSLNHPLKNENGRPHFVAVTTLEDVQAVRCGEFHPSGRVYAVGSNSKTFRICEYPSLSDIREEHTTYQPTVLFKRTKHHKGSIYCMGWAPDGELIATGSNDKTIKLMRYDEIKQQLEGREIELTMHDGTIRDLCFLEDTTNKTSLLISGGAGDCKIYVTDCSTATPFQALSGHGGHILSLYNWGGAMFVSGSQDKTIRFWDLRTRGCVNTITPATTPGSKQGSPVASVCVDPSGRLLVSGHEDSSCVLYDIRGNRPIQCFKPHSADIRSIRFSPSAYYLLTTGYDNKLVLTDLQGDLTLPLPSVVVAHHADKVISGRWHPNDFSFLSTSADKTATLWALPPL